MKKDNKNKQIPILSQASPVSCFYHHCEYWLGLFKTEIIGQKAITYPMPVLYDYNYSALLTYRISGLTGEAPCQSSSYKRL